MLASLRSLSVHFQPHRKVSQNTVAKRLFDLTVASLLLLMASLPMVMLCILVRFRLGSPILFRQKRPGRDACHFELIKFRSMTNAKGDDGRLLSDSERLTPFGRWLRSTSLDELPTLWNVICGEMSLVGPRPLLVHYVDLYSAFQARRHEVRPGITGWAQINGRNAISWNEKFALDVWYVDHVSFSLDVRILALTLLKVWQRDGITAQDNVSMPEFRGNDKGHEI
jgi:sugar transferase EpsL